MRPGWLHRRKNRLLVVLLLLPALAARIMVPPGFMPGNGEGNSPTMQMCHGAGPLPTPLQPRLLGDDPAPEPRKHHEPPCVFAAVGSSAPPPIASLDLGALQAPDSLPLAPERAVVRRAFHRAQSARAPPSGFRPA
jgi:hypothetical protein